MRNGKLHFLCSVSCPQISAFSRNPGIQNYRKWKIWFWWYGKKTFSTLNFFSQKFFLDLFSISQWNWTKMAQFIQRKFCKSFYNQGKLKQNKMENLVLIISFFFHVTSFHPHETWLGIPILFWGALQEHNWEQNVLWIFHAQDTSLLEKSNCLNNVTIKLHFSKLV